MRRNRIGILGDQALHSLVMVKALINPYSDDLESIVCLKTTDETGSVPFVVNGTAHAAEADDSYCVFLHGYAADNLLIPPEFRQSLLPAARTGFPEL